MWNAKAEPARFNEATTASSVIAGSGIEYANDKTCQSKNTREGAGLKSEREAVIKRLSRSSQS